MSDFYDKYQENIDGEENKLEETRFEAVEHKPILIENKAQKKRNKTIVSLSAVGVILLVAAYLIFRGLNYVSIPNFEGWTKSSAIVWGNQNNVIINFEEAYSDEVEEGLIFNQAMKPSSSIKKGTRLDLNASLGLDLNVKVLVPNLKEMSKSEIEMWAQDNHFVNLRVYAKYSSSVASGEVIEVDIEDPNFVDTTKRSTEIYITISKGKEDITKREVEVPDFSAMTSEQAEAYAQQNSLELKVIKEHNSHIGVNQLISQSVSAGEKIKLSTVLTLKYSLGEEVLMPNLYGLTRDEVMNEIQSLNLIPTVKDRYSQVKEGTLSWQSIRTGANLNTDSKLTLYFSLGSEINLGSFEGGQLVYLQNYIKEHNKNGASLNLEITYTQSREEAGSILRQSVKHQNINYKSTINVVVSEGMNVVVPDFVANQGSFYKDIITRDKAIDLAQEAGLVVIFIQEDNAERLNGEVWSQSFEAGTEIKKGSTITLKYNQTDATIEVADFTGMNLEQIKNHQQFEKLNIIVQEGYSQEGISTNLIYSQSIKAGTTVSEGSQITLIITP